MKREFVPVPPETAAALLLACVAIEDIVASGSITPELLDELNYLRPQLNEFAAMA